MGLVQSCWQEPAQSQGVLIIPLAGYVAWLRWHVMLSKPVQPDNRGLFAVATGLVLYVVGILAADLFLPRISFLILLAGIIWCVWGKARLRALGFPLALFATSIPLPALLYDALSFPLKMLASHSAARIGQLLGIALYQDGNVIHLARISFGVEEACDGMNALSALVVSSLFFGFLTPCRLRARVVLMSSAVPVAIAINIVRIAGTAILADRHEQLAFGFYHSFSGWLTCVAGFGILYALFKAINSFEQC